MTLGAAQSIRFIEPLLVFSTTTATVTITATTTGQTVRSRRQHVGRRHLAARSRGIRFLTSSTVSAGGEVVDVLRVPQFLNTTEILPAMRTLTTAAPQSVADDGYDDAIFDTWMDSNGDPSAANDYFGLHAPFPGQTALLFKKPGIYRLFGRAGYEDNVGGTYRACELFVYSDILGGTIDAAPADTPQWEATMGTVTCTMDIVVPVGHADAEGQRCHVTLYLSHDAGEALDVSLFLQVWPLALFESLD